MSAAVFLGELGNPEYFHHAKQIIKYAGYDPQESDSGKRIGRKVISKKGRWLLRKFLFLISLRIVVHSKYFQAYYKRRLETKNRFGQLLKKKEALCAVVIKLIKVIFALLRDKTGISGYGEFYSCGINEIHIKWLWWKRIVLLRRHTVACVIQLGLLPLPL